MPLTYKLLHPGSWSCRCQLWRYLSAACCLIVCEVVGVKFDPNPHHTALPITSEFGGLNVCSCFMDVRNTIDMHTRICAVYLQQENLGVGVKTKSLACKCDKATHTEDLKFKMRSLELAFCQQCVCYPDL